MQQGEHHPFMERCSPFFLSNKIRQSTTKNTAIHSAFQKNICKFARHFHNGNTTSHKEMECGKRHITDI